MNATLTLYAALGAVPADVTLARVVHAGALAATHDVTGGARVARVADTLARRRVAEKALERAVGAEIAVLAAAVGTLQNHTGFFFKYVHLNLNINKRSPSFRKHS